jgi:hypothetical protein
MPHFSETVAGPEVDCERRMMHYGRGYIAAKTDGEACRRNDENVWIAWPECSFQRELIHALLCAQFCITDRMKSIDTGLLFLFT